MASIANDENGRKRIQFIAGDGSRKAVRLGKVSTRQAESAKVKVEQLVSAVMLGHPPDDETVRWLATLEDRTYARLVKVGLATPRAGRVGQPTTMKAFLDGYIAGRTE